MCSHLSSPLLVFETATHDLNVRVNLPPGTVAAIAISTATHPHSSIAGAQGYWRFGAIPRAVPVVWNQYTFYSIGYTTTLVVASTFYSTHRYTELSN